MERLEIDDPRPSRRKTMLNDMRRASMAPVVEAQGGKAECQGISRWEAWSNMVLSLIGGLVCFLPSCMSDAGYLMSPPLLLVAGLVIIRTGYLICGACSLAEDMTGARLTGYEELAREVGMVKILAVSKNTVLVGNTILFQMFLRDSLAGMWPGGVDAAPKRMIYWLLLTPFFCAVALLRDLTELSRWAFIGLIGMTIELIGLFACCIRACFQDGSPSHTSFPEGDWRGQLGMTLSVFVFAFSVMALVPSVRLS